MLLRKHEADEAEKNQAFEKKYKEFVKSNNERQKEIISNINKSMIENKESQKKQKLLERKNPWADNQFFEKLWADKYVMLDEKRRKKCC